ncbi:hypothetical protein [Hymenobacter swuensis]|uniref:Uncharacterized protein n=1 Tax=Hymenobacter swuensis DY53 TaxID=1227739 RepID=W8FDJ9_9BACT|nr:hypothetical protein [Hymenobacter swuensis]AHJ99775.1 hypothetical protein Hsw_4180 [Hymenobacter swuensis DY53]
MAHRSSEANQESQEKHDRKADIGTPKADALPAGTTDEQTEDHLEQEATDAGTRHPNRNLHKPDLDKPGY